MRERERETERQRQRDRDREITIESNECFVSVASISNGTGACPRPNLGSENGFLDACDSTNGTNVKIAIVRRVGGVSVL